jgi:hypothetical protein
MNSFQAGIMTAEKSIKRDFLPFSDFLNDLKIKIRRIFINRENHDQLSLNLGITRLRSVRLCPVIPFSLAFPKNMGQGSIDS